MRREDRDSSRYFTAGSLPLHITVVNEVERCTFQVFQVVDLVLQVCHQLISLLRHLTQLALHLHTIQETPLSLPSEVHTRHVPQ